MSETAPDGDESGTAAPKRKGKGKRKHTVLKVVAISVVLLGLVTGLAVTYAYRHLSGNITTADFTEAFVEPPLEKESTGPQGAINILVMGSDTRAGEGNNIDDRTRYPVLLRQLPRCDAGRRRRHALPAGRRSGAGDAALPRLAQPTQLSSTVLQPGQDYTSTTIYAFSTT